MEGGLMMDEDAASIVAQIKTLLKQLRTKGATDKEIDSLLSDQQPGRAYVNTQGKLVLPDEGEVQIKLTPMERTLYMLLLRYPTGINADELWRYWDELCEIYGSQTVYDDKDLIEDAVEGICDEEKVTWYTNVSRIKKKISDRLGKRAAEQYIIRRGEDGLYRISAKAVMASRENHLPRFLNLQNVRNSIRIVPSSHMIMTHLLFLSLCSHTLCRFPCR